MNQKLIEKEGIVETLSEENKVSYFVNIILVQKILFQCLQGNVSNLASKVAGSAFTEEVPIRAGRILLAMCCNKIFLGTAGNSSPIGQHSEADPNIHRPCQIGTKSIWKYQFVLITK